MAADDAKDFALERLEQAYQRETEQEIKLNLASQMVRIGKAEALKRLKQIPADDPLFIARMEDYLEMVQRSSSQ